MSSEDLLYRTFAKSMGVTLKTESDGTVTAEMPKTASAEDSMEELILDAFFDEMDKIAKAQPTDK